MICVVIFLNYNLNPDYGHFQAMKTSVLMCYASVLEHCRFFTFISSLG